MVSVKFFKLRDFLLLKDDWQIIQHGRDMTAFQSFSWYKIICRQYEMKANLIPGKAIFAAAYDNDKIKMIAPVFIVSLPSVVEKLNVDNGAHILGKWGYTDYLNFIYDDFSEECFEKIVSAVKEKYHVSAFNLHQILPETEMRKYLDNKYPESFLFNGDCARIPVKEDFDAYFKLLSKNVRQNLRTAQNRANKDGIDIHYEIHKSLSVKDAEEFYEIYRERQAIKNNEPEKASNPVMKIADAFASHKKNKFNFLVQAMSSIDNGFILGCYSGTEKIGLCFGAEDKNGIRIPVVCFKQDFARYSPCMLCIFNFIKDSFENGTIKTFDLLKGSEQYKFNLGGERFSIGYYKINL